MEMICVTGSPGSGKTSVACQLARSYANQGKRVIVVFTDMLLPPISYLISSNIIKKEDALSLGSLLSDYEVNQTKIWKSACTVMSGKIALLGYLKGDAADSYPALTDYCIENFLAQMQKIDVDIVIWDVSDVNNMLYRRLAAYKPRTVSVLRSVPKDLTWAVRNDGFNADVIVLNAVTRWQEASIPGVPSSKVQCLPWSEKVNFNMNSMDAFGNVDGKFSKTITKLQKRLAL